METARRSGALHSAWSGAGPTAVAITKDPGRVVAAMERTLAGSGRVVILDVAETGWM
jgi:shikimate kinase